MNSTCSQRVIVNTHQPSTQAIGFANWPWIIMHGLIVILLTAVIGCGGGERRDRDSVKSDDEAIEAEADSINANTSDRTEESTADGRDGSRAEVVAVEDVEAEVAEPEPVPSRPEDVADWKRLDFKSAKIEKDPQLADAVEYVDENYKGKSSAAKILLSLLTLDKPPANAPANTSEVQAEARNPRGGNSSTTSRRGMLGGRGGRGERGGGGGGRNDIDESLVQIDSELAREVIAAVGRNNSKFAIKSLHKLLTGTIETPLTPQDLFADTLAAMFDNPGKEHDEKIYILATTPEDIIPEPKDEDDRSALSPDSVYDDVKEEMIAKGSVELRTQIAHYLDKKDLPEDIVSDYEGFLSEDDNRNLPAQIVLYQGDLIEDSTRETLQERLTQGSQAALGYLMGIKDVTTNSNSGRGTGGRDRGGSARGGGNRGGSGVGGRGEGGRRGAGGGRIGGTGRRNSVHYYVGSFLLAANSFSNSTLNNQPASRSLSQHLPLQFLPNFTNSYAQRSRGGRGGGRSGRGGRGNDENGEELNPQEVYGQLAELLWTDEMVVQIGYEVQNIKDLNQVSGSLALLASIPTERAREMIKGIYEDHDDEPNDFESAGMLGKEMADPSFLLVAKSSYHGKKKKRPSRGRNSGGRGGRGGSGGGIDDKDPWQDPVEGYVIALGERLTDAESTWVEEPVEETDDSEVENEEDAEPTSNSDERSLAMQAMGIRLHRGAEVRKDYHMRWPTDVQTKLPGVEVAPLQVHYIRMEQEVRPSKVNSFYRRFAGSDVKVIEKEDEGVWYDGLTRNRKTGERRSIDVRIFNEDGRDSDLRDSDPRDMIIEILVIIIPGEEVPEETAPAEEEKKDDAAASVSKSRRIFG